MESMNAAEFEAERQKRIEYKRAYNRTNRESLIAKRASATLRNKLPRLLAELRELTDARNARDAGDAWWEWAKGQEVAAKKHYGIPPDKSPYTHSEASRQYRKDIIVQWISSVRWTLGCPKYLYGSQIDARHAELEAQLSAIDQVNIDAALFGGESTPTL